MGERFFDALIADTLSERYRPSEVDADHRLLMDAGVRIAHTYAKQRERIAMLDVRKEMADWKKDFDERRQLPPCNHNHGKYTVKNQWICAECDGALDDHDCLRSPLSRLGDWFAGLFAIDPTITID